MHLEPNDAAEKESALWHAIQLSGEPRRGLYAHRHGRDRLPLQGCLSSRQEVADELDRHPTLGGWGRLLVNRTTAAEIHPHELALI